MLLYILLMIINDTVYYTYRGSKFFRDGMDLTWHMFGMPQKTMLAHFLVKLSGPQPPQPNPFILRMI